MGFSRNTRLLVGAAAGAKNSRCKTHRARLEFPNDLASCQHLLATSQQMVAELLTTVGQLRATIDKQAAHIHYLVRMTLAAAANATKGRRSSTASLRRNLAHHRNQNRSLKTRHLLLRL
jgi:hypothetical protein